MPGYPTQLPVFSSEPVPAAAGAELTARVEVRESDRAGVGKLCATATDVQVTGEPEGLAGWAAHVSDTFRALVVDTVGPSSQGLIPGMVLGDTALQDTAEHHARNQALAGGPYGIEDQRAKILGYLGCPSG